MKKSLLKKLSGVSIVVKGDKTDSPFKPSRKDLVSFYSAIPPDCFKETTLHSALLTHLIWRLIISDAGASDLYDEYKRSKEDSLLVLLHQRIDEVYDENLLSVWIPRVTVGDINTFVRHFMPNIREGLLELHESCKASSSYRVTHYYKTKIVPLLNEIQKYYSL